MALTLKADEAKALTAEAEPNESVGNSSLLLAALIASSEVAIVGPPDEPLDGPQYPPPDWWNGSAAPRPVLVFPNIPKAGEPIKSKASGASCPNPGLFCCKSPNHEDGGC